MKRISIILFLLLLPLAMFSQKVKFSQKGGFYEESFYLTLSCDEAYHIRYTTDGNDPTAKSKRYKAPLWLDERMYSKADIYKIQISPDSLVFIPESMKHAIVIRAALFDANDSCVSRTFTNTYLIRSLGIENHGMAAVSVCADYDDLFDNDNGIFVRGATWNPKKPDHTGNYYQHGKKWERRANVEFYEPGDNNGINQVCGLRTHGNRVRREPAKGMKIYARNEYGKKRFKHPFFGEDYIDSFNHLVLKPFGSHWPFCGLQDYLCQKLALQLGVTSANSRPVMLFLNGEYWGIYFIQEKPDDSFLEDHFGVGPKNCNIISAWYGEVDKGTDTTFKEMMSWFKSADLSDDAQYGHACSLIDVQNFIDYYVFETFIGNHDWPGNNTRCWQEVGGKWQWIFFDGDAAIIDHEFNLFDNAAVYKEPKTWINYPEAKLIFGKMLQNNQFRKSFKARAYEWCSGPLRYDSIYPMFNDIVEQLRPHIDDQTQRFGYPKTFQRWESGVNRVNDFLATRVDNYLKLIDECPYLQSEETPTLPEQQTSNIWCVIVAIVVVVAVLTVIIVIKIKRKHK